MDVFILISYPYMILQSRTFYAGCMEVFLLISSSMHDTCNHGTFMMIVWIKLYYRWISPDDTGFPKRNYNIFENMSKYVPIDPGLLMVIKSNSLNYKRILLLYQVSVRQFVYWFLLQSIPTTPILAFIFSPKIVFGLK